MSYLNKLVSFIIVCSIFITNQCLAKSTIVTIYSLADENNPAQHGQIILQDSPFGLLIKPKLSKLTPGLHGLHIHEKPECSKGGTLAGGHYDPHATGKHLGPYNVEGHLGDLPALYVDESGNATLPSLAPRIKLEMIKKRSLMIHAGSDNYSDIPPMGGGGARVACGIIDKLNNNQ